MDSAQKRHGNLKLTEAQAICILEMGKAGKTQREIARQMGVSQVNISYILRGRTWKHLQREDKGSAEEWVASKLA